MLPLIGQLNTTSWRPELKSQPDLYCKASSCMTLVGSLQYRTLTNCIYYFPQPFQLPVTITDTVNITQYNGNKGTRHDVNQLIISTVPVRAGVVICHEADSCHTVNQCIKVSFINQAWGITETQKHGFFKTYLPVIINVF